MFPQAISDLWSKQKKKKVNPFIPSLLLGLLYYYRILLLGSLISRFIQESYIESLKYITIFGDLCSVLIWSFYIK